MGHSQLEAQVDGGGSTRFHPTGRFLLRGVQAERPHVQCSVKGRTLATLGSAGLCHSYTAAVRRESSHTQQVSKRGCNLMSLFAQPPSRVQLIETPWTAALQSSLSFTISRRLPKFMSIAS